MQKSSLLSIPMTEKEQRLGLVYLIASLLLIPTAVTRTVRLLFPDAGAAAQNFTYFAINFLCVCGIFRRFLRKSVKAAAEHPVRLCIPVIVGLGAYLLMSALLALLLRLIAPGFSNVNDGSIAGLAAQSYLLMAFGTVFLVPAAEEVLYRGLVFGSLLKKSPAAAYLISTLVFCSIHVVSYIGKYAPSVLLLCFVQYIPAGICLGWAYRRADSILAPIAIHMIINAIGILAVR